MRRTSLTMIVLSVLSLGWIASTRAVSYKNQPRVLSHLWLDNYPHTDVSVATDIAMIGERVLFFYDFPPTLADIRVTDPSNPELLTFSIE